MDDDMEPGEQPASHDHEPGLQAPGSEADPTAASASASAVAVAAAATAASASARPHPAPLAAPTLYAFLLNTPLNSILAGFLATRDLFFLQFLNRNCFTLLNSNAALLQQYYTTARLDRCVEQPGTNGQTNGVEQRRLIAVTLCPVSVLLSVRSVSFLFLLTTRSSRLS